MPSNTVMEGNIATTLLLLLLVLCHGVAITIGERTSSSKSSYKMFLMQDSKSVVKAEAGEMRVLESHEHRGLDRRMHIGFITMEPKSLFIPQYLDSNLVIFIRRGEAKLGFIYGDELSERRLKTGDVYVIPAGSAFYLVNLGEGQRLHIICSIDPSTSMEDTFQSFYIGGGDNTQSVLAGFEPVILETAFNESRRELSRIFNKRLDGPIVFVDDSHAPSLWTKFLQLKKEDKVQNLKKMVQVQEEHNEEEEQTIWSWRKLLETVLGKENKKADFKGTADSPDSYNLYDRNPDFRNDYGWSSAVDGDDYPPLRTVDTGVFHVNLTAIFMNEFCFENRCMFEKSFVDHGEAKIMVERSKSYEKLLLSSMTLGSSWCFRTSFQTLGSMMVPHLNPRAMEYGIVLRGYGRIQIVFPNGSNAMETEIKEGDVFFVPRYFPFCQIASRTGPLEFFGFSTSARKNKPQFLVGAASILRTMMGPELAAAFGVSEDTLRRVVDAQHEVLIVPSTWAAPGPGEPGEPRPGDEGKKEDEDEDEDEDEKSVKVQLQQKGVKGFDNDDEVLGVFE